LSDLIVILFFLLFNFVFGFGWNWYVAECFGSVLAKILVGLEKSTNTLFIISIFYFRITKIVKSCTIYRYTHNHILVNCCISSQDQYFSICNITSSIYIATTLTSVAQLRRAFAANFLLIRHFRLYNKFSSDLENAIENVFFRGPSWEIHARSRKL